jgi:hypothetical protein
MKMGGNINIIKSTETVWHARSEIGIEMNAEKTKYIFMPHCTFWQDKIEYRRSSLLREFTTLWENVIVSDTCYRQLTFEKVKSAPRIWQQIIIIYITIMLIKFVCIL